MCADALYVLSGGRFFLLFWLFRPTSSVGLTAFELGHRDVLFRHYRNLNKTEPRLDALLTRFRFAPLSDILPAGSSQPSEMSNVEIQMTK